MRIHCSGRSFFPTGCKSLQLLRNHPVFPLHLEDPLVLVRLLISKDNMGFLQYYHIMHVMLNLYRVYEIYPSQLEGGIRILRSAKGDANSASRLRGVNLVFPDRSLEQGFCLSPHSERCSSLFLRVLNQTFINK